MHKVLVVPTIRQHVFNHFLNTWAASQIQDWATLIVVEDNPEKTFAVPSYHCHFSWKEIKEELGDDSEIFSKRDSAIRSFGFLKACELEADYIFTLDDDCLPFGDELFCERHLKNMDETPKWTELIPDKRTRGLPYRNKGKLDNVVANIGLWCGVPDLDAVETLSRGQQTDYMPPMTDRVIPSGQYFPWCGMNFAFKREIAVLTYFPLMGMGSPYARFDDMWFGLIAKKICDHLRLYVTVGRPWVRHNKASDVITNLVKEAPGIGMNEWMWEIIEKIKLTSSTPAECMKEVGESLKLYDGSEMTYLQKLGDCICRWVNLFKNLP